VAQQEWLYGLHSIAAVLNNEPERILDIMVAKGRDDARMNDVVKLARKQGVAVQFVQRKTLDDKSKGEQHQGILARAKPAKVLDEGDLDTIIKKETTPFLLVLDGVTDPHNLGACL
jgi:23S rRNA (guanosine2251-2'-O)-methyltransferase